jgi:SNF2 family DNA or RNA helicase
MKSGKAHVLVANMDSLGHGINLQYINRVLFAELPFRKDRFTQAVGRVHRQGQKSRCFVDVPLAKGTIQGSIYHRLIENSEDLKHIYHEKESLRRFLR